MRNSPSKPLGLHEAFWLLSALRMAVKVAASVRIRREAFPLWKRLGQEVHRLQRLLDRLQLALLYVDVVGDQTLDAALLRRFDLLLTAREAYEAWRTLHQELLLAYPENSAALIEAVRNIAHRFDWLNAETPAVRWQATLRLGKRVLRAVRHQLLRRYGELP